MSSPDPLPPLPPHQSAVPLQYATPPAYSVTNASFFREGDQLVVPKISTLPPCCIRCGAQGTHTQQKKLSWIHPAWLLLILVNWLILLIVYLVIRKQGEVIFYRCDACRQSWSRRKLWIWLGALVPLGVMIAGIALGGFSGRSRDEPYLMMFMFGLLGLLLYLIVPAILLRGVTAAKINDTHMWLKGIDRSFDASAGMQAPYAFAPPMAMPVPPPPYNVPNR